MTLIEVKKGLNEALQTLYQPPKYQFYGVDVVEGYQRPCFFTKLQSIQMQPENYNTYFNQAAFYITYMQKEVDEVDIMKKVEEIKELFKLYIKIGKRAIDVTNFDYDFIGNDKNILEISIDLEWMDRIEHKTNQPLMADFFIRKGEK
ncbi:MAG: hypothetical protein HFJ09_05460 [Lachnospiraceae bacterium]|nr:hypothetical protein [Lachnospiraceae bacterium]